MNWLPWHLGAGQGDIALPKGEDVDWPNGTVSFTRRKTGVPVVMHLGSDALNISKDLPSEGVLFSVSLVGASGRQSHGIWPVLPPTWNQRRHATQLPLRMG
jgi:hypothetical protein